MFRKINKIFYLFVINYAFSGLNNCFFAVEKSQSFESGYSHYTFLTANQQKTIKEDELELEECQKRIIELKNEMAETKYDDILSEILTNLKNKTDEIHRKMVRETEEILQHIEDNVLESLKSLSSCDNFSEGFYK